MSSQYPTLWHLDEKYKTGQGIQPNHQQIVPHDHTVVTSVKVLIRQYGLVNYVYPDKPIEYDIGIVLYDLSKYVTDYSYDCSESDNIRTSASVTCIRPPDLWNATWAKREYEENFWSMQGGSYGREFPRGTCVQIIKTYYFPETGLHREMDLGYFINTSNSDSFSTTSETFTMSLVNMACLLQPEYGGNVNRLVQKIWKKGVRKYIVKENGKDKIKSREVQVQTSVLSNPYIPYGQTIDSNYVHHQLLGSWGYHVSAEDTSHIIPVRGVWLDWVGVKTFMIHENKEFPYDASRQDVIQYICDNCYVNGHYWVNEENYFEMTGQAENKNCIGLYKDYGDLVIDESRSYDDSNYYNTINVISHVTIDGVEVTYFGREDFSQSVAADHYRVMYIEDNTLQSDKECEDRARWECWKAMWGHETFTVTLEDNYIPMLLNPSTKVGKTVEYRTITGYSLSMLVEKISYSSNKFTLTLKPFKPLYYAAFDELTHEPNETAKRTLGAPQIVGHKVWQDDDGKYYVRLYVEGDDVDYGIVRGFIYSNIFGLDANNRFKENAVGESAYTENGVHYVDMPVTENKDYYFQCQLFSPYYEDSGLSSIRGSSQENELYKVTVTEIRTYEPEMIDPYPHPIMPRNKYLTNENNDNLSDENANIIYTSQIGG